MDGSHLTLHEHFAGRPDPRMDRTKRHQLLDILVIALDGKTVRRSHDRSKGKAAIQMIRAGPPLITWCWANSRRRKVDESWHQGQAAQSWLERRLPPQGLNSIRYDCPGRREQYHLR